METTVAALLLITSTVLLSCIVILYAVDTIQQSFSGDSAQVKLINEIQENILNQTAFFNSTLPAAPTPTPQQ